MSADNDGRVSQNADNPMNHVGLDLDNLELTVLDFLNIPSPHITPYHMLDIYKKIKETAGQYDGVVIHPRNRYSGRDSLLPRHHGRP